MDNPVNIFLSYARKDEKLATQLRYYLRPLEMQGLAASKAQVSYQQSLWEQDLPSPNPYLHEFNMLKDDLQETSDYIRSYKEKLLVTDDPKQKETARSAIKGLESKFNSLVKAYNELRGKLELPPRSIDDVRELLSTL